MPVRTFVQAAKYIEQVGFCLLFPIKGLPLPSLWAAVKGRQLVPSAAEGPRGFNLVAAWDADAEKLWGWKDEFPKRRRAWYGKYFRGKASLIAPAFLPCFYRLEGNDAAANEPERLYRQGRLTEDARAIAAELERHGAAGVLELRHALGWTTPRGNRRFKRALEELQRRLLVTRWGTAAETNAWESAVYQLTARVFPRPVRTAAKLAPEEARRRIAAQYRRLNPRATPRELQRAFGWLKPDATAALAEE